MATKKDLVEAYSFSRRRLVTAFVSGAPGGREVEPSRPGRTIVGGIALAVLMIAAAAVLGILTDRDPGDWEKQGLVSEKETGANYVILSEGGELRPVVNITSAMLLLGPDLTKTDVGRDAIAEKERGEPIGILQAPGTPPAAANLRPTGWTACTGVDRVSGEQYGVKVTLTGQDVVAATPGVGYLVRSSGRTYLIGESAAGTTRGEPRAYAYQVPGRNPDPVLRGTVDQSVSDAIEVAPEWLALFTPGAPLALPSFGLDARRLGQSPDEPAPGLPPGVRVGDLVTAGSDTYLVNDRGPATELDSFSAAVYAAVPKGRFRPVEVEGSTPGRIQDAGDLGTGWPTAELTPKASGEYCAQLDAVPGGAPGVRLADVADDAASAAGVGSGAVDPYVEPGSGALVQIGDWDTIGETTTALVDDRGFVYTLIADARQQLGYGDVEDVIVPTQWTDLFQEGVELSVDAARCPPTTESRTGPCAT